MAPFKVKAVYDYTSPHEDDLSFPAGQIISVTEEEDDEWYVGEYMDDGGVKKSGLFPKNFVDKYEPEPPPRPNRASRHRPSDTAAVVEPSSSGPLVEPEHEELPTPKPPAPSAPPADVAAAPSAPPTSPPSTIAKSETTQKPSPAPKSTASIPTKVPPPVAEKPSLFRDRIAAFNKPAAAPIAPFKPGGAPSTFVKKPFVAPPPSRNAYVPPPREAPQVKAYRRDEDPEIAERAVQDQENAEKAGLAGTGAEGDESQSKPTSLKERIALLQKQQQEQAQRAAAMQKEKPKKPPKKRTESFEGRGHEGEGIAQAIDAEDVQGQVSLDKSHVVQSPEMLPANRELFSDANDADQSGAGETEDAEGASTGLEEEEDRFQHHAARAAAAPAEEPDVGDEQDEDEDEMDAETRRKLELRERMAKMSGGVGMAGMLGGGMPMGALPPKRMKPERKATGDGEPSVPRVPMVPVPGMSAVRSPEPQDKQLAAEDALQQDSPVDVAKAVPPAPPRRTLTGDRPPPVPSQRKFLVPRKPIRSALCETLEAFQSEHTRTTVSRTYISYDGASEYAMTVSVSKRPAPPPVPQAERPAPRIPSSSRPVPPDPLRSPSPGSESGDEMTEAPPPSSPKPATQAPKRASLAASDASFDSPEKRAPPASMASPPLSPSIRPPPPLPPSVPPSRHGTMDSGARQRATAEKSEGETEYEGDYDTDIAPGATHKAALKAHARDSSMDESTTADDSTPAVRTPATALPPTPSVPRAVPPLPLNQAPNRASMDAPRAAPPPPPMPPPSRDADAEDGAYDPYNYSALQRAAPVPPKGPPPQTHPPPPSVPPMPPPTQPDVGDSSEEDLYSSPPPRRSHDRPPPPPPHPQERAAPPPPPHERAVPPPPSERPVPPPPPRERGVPQPPLDRAAPQPPEVSSAHKPSGRKSLEANRALQGRVSMEQSRPSGEFGFIASDIDLGASSHWWTQPQMPPPQLQNRKDILTEMAESRSGTLVEKAVFVLYLDYSQTVVSAHFDAHDVSHVELSQRHEAPPPRPRQDQLEAAHETYGAHIARDTESKQSTVVGDGTPHALIHALLGPSSSALKPISTRSFGAMVYSNLANASTQQADEIRAGDIISFRNARFQGKHGPMHAKYAVDVGKPDHVGVVVDWDGTKKKVRAWEQGRESKKVKVESFKMGDLRSGEVRVWRVMGREWVGWKNEA